MALAAVYRTIQLLNELNLIDRVSFDDGFAGYETGSAPDREQRYRHYYLICRRYGRVFSLSGGLIGGAGRGNYGYRRTCGCESRGRALQLL